MAQASDSGGAGGGARGAGPRKDRLPRGRTDGRAGPSPPWSRGFLRRWTPRSSSLSPMPPPWRHKGEGASRARAAAGSAPNGCPWFRRAPHGGGGSEDAAPLLIGSTLSLRETPRPPSGFSLASAWVPSQSWSLRSSPEKFDSATPMAACHWLSFLP